MTSQWRFELGHGLAGLLRDGEISPTVQRAIGNELAQRVTASCFGHLVVPTAKSQRSRVAAHRAAT
jgi:hypothetical protein